MKEEWVKGKMEYYLIHEDGIRAFETELSELAESGFRIAHIQPKIPEGDYFWVLMEREYWDEDE